MHVYVKCYNHGYIVKAISNFEIHQELFKIWFTLLHFAMDDPVIVHGGRKLKIVLILGFFCPIYVIGNCLKKQAGS